MQPTHLSMAVDVSQKITLADHVATQTYPLVKDPKILLTACQYLADAGEAIKQEGRKLTQEQFETIETVQKIVQQHKDSPIEFRRKQNFVICQDDYKFSVLNQDTVNRHIKVMRTLL